MSELRQFLITFSVLAVIVNVECQYSNRRFNNRGNSQSDVVFPDAIPSGDRFQNDDSSRSHHMYSREAEEELPRISIELSKRLNDLTSYESFFDFLDPDSLGPNQVLRSRFGVENVERSLSKQPVMARCKPEMTVVPLKLEDENETKDPSILIFPSCTRVNRCGGCCHSNLLSCQPNTTQQIIFEVAKSRIPMNSNKLQLISKELVFVEEHTSCICDCRKKESDCTKFQIYDKERCGCKCFNTEDRRKCFAQNELKIWDSKNCLCQCRETTDCTTYTVFDTNTCKCTQALGPRRDTPPDDRKRFIAKPFAVEVPETPQTLYQTAP